MKEVLPVAPRVVATDENFWKAVGLISGARRYGNKSVSFPAHRSRGAEGDIRTEIMGVWGELATWKWADESELPVTVPCLVSLTGPSTEVDFIVPDPIAPIGLEAKAWNAMRVDGSIADPFSTMNINVTGHERSYKRGGDYYVFSFGIIGGDATVVGKPVPHEWISSWPSKDGKYGDPYFACPIRELVPIAIPGKNSFSMVRWISSQAPSALPMEAVISTWREAAEQHIDAVMRACESKGSGDFFDAIRRIK